MGPAILGSCCPNNKCPRSHVSRYQSQPVTPHSPAAIAAGIFPPRLSLSSHSGLRIQRDPSFLTAARNPALGAMRRLLALALLAASTAAAAASDAGPILRMVPDAPTAISSGADADAFVCDSWRLSVETGNAGPWLAVPPRCWAFVRAYMEGDRYASDSAVVAADSLAFVSQAVAAGVGGARPAWVFDVDETLLSNAPYYADNDWGSQEFNETSFDEWVDAAKAPALPSSLKLYNELQGLGFHVILLTGRSEFQRNSTEANLLFAGYRSWEKLILRQPSDIGKTAVQYKSERRAAMEAEGFKILGNSGDQWSDLIGSPMAMRSFKLPNPMYFIS